MVKLSKSLFLSWILIARIECFQILHPNVNRRPLRARLNMATLPTSEESAQTLSDYMAKSHEAKLQAVAEVENKKNTEIKALKEELEALKASRGNSIELASAQSPPPTVEGSNEELMARIAQYQKFMADYVVKSSEEKFRAVKEAEAKVADKYEAKMLLLGAGEAGSAGTAAPIEVKGSSTFQKRNAKVVASAKAGKSRWGDDEIGKAASSVNGLSAANAPPPSVVDAPKPEVVAETTAKTMEKVPAEVVEADHGMRADGGVGGLTLAERVMMGSSASGEVNSSAAVAVADPASASRTILFDKRNERVTAAANAGKNYRWAELEVWKAGVDAEQKRLNGVNGASDAALKVIPEVKEADKGLRADGGVEGPSLLERVNLGAAMLQ